MKYFRTKDVSFSKDSCNVKYGKNIFRGDLNTYKIKIDPDDFDGVGFEVSLSSNIKPYRPQDGIIKAGDDYFAWLAAVPNGTVSGKLVVGEKTISISGSGYHDHNWGNTPLQYLFDGWVWFRGEIEDKTVVASVLYMADKRGGYDIPILYVADRNEVLVNKFGEDGGYKRSDIINDFTKSNEPHSPTDFITENGFQVKIKGKDVG